jgi:hypothetical protein
MADLDLAPHPLVSEVAIGLFGLRGVSAPPPAQTQRHAQDVANALESAASAAAESGLPPADTPDRNAQALAGSSGLPALVTFMGYLGATLQKDDGATFDPDNPHRGLWSLLYLDTRLWNWLLVRTDGIVYRDAIRDEQAPFRRRDVLWVTADTAVGLGDGSLAVEAQFLTGTFTQASDFDDRPTSGGTLSAATGVFCEARSVVGCCLRKSRV